MNIKLLTKIFVYTLIVVLTGLVFLFIINKPSQALIVNVFGGNRLQASLVDASLLSSAEIIVPENLKPARDWMVPDFKITARAALCVEVSKDKNDKVLFQENDKEKLPIASLSKLMAALVVIENYDLQDVTFIGKAAVDQSGAQGSLTEGEYLSLDSLLHIALIESSNDATYSLAEVMGLKNFVNLMNLRAVELGLLDTNFNDPAGLDVNNYSTVRDLVKLTKYLLDNHPEIWEILSQSNYKIFTPEGKVHHIATNTNELLGEIPNIVGGKTGQTLEAKGCLLIVTKNQQNQDNLIYVLLGSSDRFSEMRSLIDWINHAYKR